MLAESESSLAAFGKTSTIASQQPVPNVFVLSSSSSESENEFTGLQLEEFNCLFLKKLFSSQ